MISDSTPRSVIRLTNMAANEQRLERDSVLGRRLWWLILGRLIVAIVLLWAGALWAHGGRGQGTWRDTLTILFVIVGTTIIYALAHRLSQALVLLPSRTLSQII